MIRRPIKVLNAEVARKIAAGEVIDRPNAIVRELMDNAVDSGATSITVEIAGGGIDKIRVIDNGYGMDEQDLATCARPHATSKIEKETDLLHLSTLGFRGEALASIAAVSRLSITSGGKKLRASITEDHIIENAQPVIGTIVQSESLFENFPARRVFLKRPASEMVMCKNTFIEKVLPKPEIAFRFTVDGEIKLDLPSEQNLVSRFVQALSIKESEKLFYKLSGSGKDFTFNLVMGEPSVARSDKKQIFIYVNGRKISEFSLIQAIEYGCQGYFPNGTHPVACLFVQMNPEVVDFNIHPAKKEARFQDIAELHHAVSSGVRNFLHQYTLKAVVSSEKETVQAKELFETGLSTEQIDSYNKLSQEKKAQDELSKSDFRSRFFSPSYTSTPSTYATKEHPFEKTPDIQTQTQQTQSSSYAEVSSNSNLYNISHQSPEELALAAAKAADIGTNSTFRFIGCTLGVFLLAEKENTLYIIDQHAAHERMLYDKIMTSQGKRQKLLVPYVIETSNVQEDSYLESIQEELDQAGFSSTNCGNGRWEISSVPERWKGTETELSRALLDKHTAPEEIISTLAAMTACKAAIKDGYVIDSVTAADIARAALELPDPHCPHGRPVFTAITREQLFELVKRT